MSLTKEDLQSIKGVLQPQFDQIRNEMQAFRLEVRQMFKAHSAQVSKAIAEAVKMMAETHATKEEVEELRDDIEDLKKQVKDLQMSRQTPS